MPLSRSSRSTLHRWHAATRRQTTRDRIPSGLASA